MNDASLLDGLRIVEMSAFVAAPLGGLTLAQLGAEVIRIDPPGGGLDFGRWPATPDGHSLFWAGLNQSKRSVAIDVKRPEGQALVRALLTAPGEGGGILLTNLRQEGALAYEHLCEERPDLIQLSVQGDREGGSAVDYTINCRVGLPDLTGPQTQKDPVNHVLPAWDLITGQMAAVGLLAAERKRRLTGRGTHVKLALEDVALAVMGQLGYLAEAQLGMERTRQGNYLFGAFGRDFVSRDGVRVMIVGLTLRQWRGLCAACGIVDEMRALAKSLDLDFDREGDRFAARREIAQRVEAWTQTRAFDDIAKVFDHHGVCWGRYQTVGQLVANDPACSEQNPMFRRIEQPGIGSVLAPGVALRFNDARLPAQAAPALGEHTQEVLAAVLKLSQAQIEDLERRRVVHCAGRH